MRKNIKDSYEKHYQDAMRIGKYKANSELLALATEHAASMIDWLEEIGVEFTDESPILVDDHDHYVDDDDDDESAKRFQQSHIIDDSQHMR